MKHVKLLLTTISLSLICLLATAKKNHIESNYLIISFYNTENLFDTIPSVNGQDIDYTPKGRLKWNSKRYHDKLNKVARVINDMNSDLVGLCEVENENVLRNLTNILYDDYCYIHRETSDPRGADIALLYKPDRFIPQKTEQLDMDGCRELLHINGVWDCRKIELIICHSPSQLNSNRRRKDAMERFARHIDSIRTECNYDILFVMGDFNCTQQSRIFKHAFGKADENGEYTNGLSAPINSHTNIGSYVYNNRWSLIDNILIDDRTFGQHIAECGVFIKDYLLSDMKNRAGSDTFYLYGTPTRTYRNGKYYGGYSDHLPIILKYTP